MAVIRLIPNGLLPDLLVEWLLSPKGQSQIHGGKVDVARANLSLADVAGIEVPLPTFEEQRELIPRILDVMNYIRSLSQNLVDLKDRIDGLDQSILGKAFLGELVPQDPSEEDASLLLARIAAEKASQKVEEKGNGKQREAEMKPKRSRQKDIITLLQETSRAMTPEEVFAACGFNEGSIDAFYERLRDAFIAKKIRELRRGDSIMLAAVKE